MLQKWARLLNIIYSVKCEKVYSKVQCYQSMHLLNELEIKRHATDRYYATKFGTPYHFHSHISFGISEKNVPPSSVEYATVV